MKKRNSFPGSTQFHRNHRPRPPSSRSSGTNSNTTVVKQGSFLRAAQSLAARLLNYRVRGAYFLSGPAQCRTCGPRDSRRRSTVIPSQGHDCTLSRGDSFRVFSFRVSSPPCRALQPSPDGGHEMTVSPGGTCYSITKRPSG